MCERNIPDRFPDLLIVDSFAHKAIGIIKRDLILRK
jgi:hypothetical protein